jgi:hypothetical protein
MDINNHNPEFPGCASYKPTVLENKPAGTVVNMVRKVFFYTNGFLDLNVMHIQCRSIVILQVILLERQGTQKYIVLPMVTNNCFYCQKSYRLLKSHQSTLGAISRCHVITLT